MPDHYDDEVGGPEEAGPKRYEDYLAEDPGSLLSNDLALQGMMIDPENAGGNITQYELNQPRYGLSGRFSRVGEGRSIYQHHPSRMRQIAAPAAPADRRVAPAGELRADDAGADAFEHGTGATGRTGADDGFGMGSDYGLALDEAGGFGLGGFGKYGISKGIGLASGIGQAAMMGASPGAIMGALPGAMAAMFANPMTMAALFGIGLDQSLDRSAFHGELMDMGSDLGLSEAGMAGAMTGAGGPTRDNAAIQEAAATMGQVRGRRGIAGRALDAFGLGTDNAGLGSELAGHAFGEEGDVYGPEVSFDDRMAAAQDIRQDVQLGTTAANVYGMPAIEAQLGAIASEQDAARAAQLRAALAGDRSGLGSRGMDIHGGVSSTEAEMARQEAAARDAASGGAGDIDSDGSGEGDPDSGWT
jgi:hypothetical protein